MQHVFLCSPDYSTLHFTKWATQILLIVSSLWVLCYSNTNCYEPVMRENIMAERPWWGRAAQLMVARKEREEKKDRKILETRYTLSGNVPSDLLPVSMAYFLQYPPPPNSSLNCESIHELIHQWDESPHDSITPHEPTFEHCRIEDMRLW